MPRSMTGYGEGTSVREGRMIRVECRSVNHRYLDVSVRLPGWLLALEPQVRSMAQEKLGRGRVEIRVTDESQTASGRTVLLDQPLAASWLSALRELEEMTGREALDPTGILAAQSGLFVLGEREEDASVLEEGLGEALELALRELNAARETEGAKLSLDLLEKTEELRLLVEEMAKRAPKIPILYREKLLARAEELLEDDRPEWYNDQRLFAETALFADRASIDEEVTRLAAHLGALEEALGSDLAVGRQLDFLIQEIFREINTIGSKANDLDLTRSVVAAKTLLEKIREQVQNIE